MSNSYMKQGNEVVSNVDEFIIEAPEEDPNFDKLNSLVTVLENDIRKAHDNSIAIEKVIMSIRNSAYESSQTPQAEHLSLLYCHISEEMKAQKRRGSAVAKQATIPNYQEQDDDDYSDTVSLTGDIPFFLYSGSSKQIVGWEALHRNVFYSRASTAVFCFVGFVVMACVPDVGSRYIDPNTLLEVPLESVHDIVILLYIIILFNSYVLCCLLQTHDSLTHSHLTHSRLTHSFFLSVCLPSRVISWRVVLIV
jgi:hypothetical protein